MKRGLVWDALQRGLKMLVISSLAGGTSFITVFQSQMLKPDGSLSLKHACAVASTSFLIAFATSVLHMLEKSLEDYSEYMTQNHPTPPNP